MGAGRAGDGSLAGGELTRQADPAEMIAAMIGVITADHPPYRTVLPKAAEDMARREQAEEWEKRL